MTRPTLDLSDLLRDPADDVFWSVNGPLVRAFVIAHERELAARERAEHAARVQRARASRVERRAQRRRRRDAWLASYGIDTGPRCIHGMVVPR
ncbi:hypothetical protein RKE29_11905 [Streptomyces sp. B1866]|uniref:hypothetical protein n=1 Tax=Streptomyces sp. B1866 TaxID=3075431 RepID=UPI002890777A|nr:hypothetical protein [Streptomyces sp. B1866]MDT3397344.1 hypothetical protein [Streptomyces sp. B1866]